MHFDFVGKKVLITTNGWFFAPDGCEYRAVFGTLKAIHEVGKTLGFIPNRAHANWFLEVGNMMIMGCQVMYVVKADIVELGNVNTWNNNPTTQQPQYFNKPTTIYNADI